MVVCALISDSVPREMRGLSMGCYNTSVYAGMMFCSISIGIIIKSEGFRFAFLVSGAIGIIVLFLFKLLYHRDPVASST